MNASSGTTSSNPLLSLTSTRDTNPNPPASEDTTSSFDDVLNQHAGTTAQTPDIKQDTVAKADPAPVQKTFSKAITDEVDTSADLAKVEVTNTIVTTPVKATPVATPVVPKGK